jgi:plasmid stabilization system protein ParE
MTHRFAEAALTEFIDAGRYYNRQVPGLGDDFADEIEAGIRKILSAPLTWPAVEDDVHRFLVRRFPYGTYNTVEGDVVVIWAVKHLHRDPDYWQQRRQ